MAIVIDDVFLKNAKVDEKELLIDIAFLIHSKSGVISLGKAREFCGLTREEFHKEMYKREISYFDEESVLQEIEEMKNRREL